MNTNLVSSAFEDYSQCLRIMLEAHTKAFRFGLIKIDFSEALGNIDVSLTATLNAFHSIHDAIQKSKAVYFDMYKSAECSTLLALRNARHHNKANKIRELHKFHEATQKRLSNIGWYIAIDFPSLDITATTYDINISWNDFVVLLESPQAESRLNSSTVQLICSYLNKVAIDKYNEFYGKKYKATFF